MIEILKSIIDLIIEFINQLARFKIDLVPGGEKISLLTLAIGFTAIVVIIYFIFKGLGFISKGDD